MKFNSFNFNTVNFDGLLTIIGKSKSSINIGLQHMIIIKLNESVASRRRIPFEMVSSEDFVTPITGLSFSASDIKVYKNGGTEASSTGAAVEIGGGLYYYEFSSGEPNTLGQLTIRVTGSGSIPGKASAQVVSFDPYDAVRIGLTSLPNAVANAANGMVTSGTGTGQISLSSGKVALIPNAVTSAEFAQSAADKIWTATTRTLSTFSFSVNTTSLDASALLAIENKIWDALPANHANAPSFGAGVNVNLAQIVPFSDVSANITQTLGDCLSVSRADGAGKWALAGSTLTLYGPDGTTIVRQFSLNDPVNPTQRT